MMLYPDAAAVAPLAAVFDKFAKRKFPALREQFDEHFLTRYATEQDAQRGGQKSLFGDLPLSPSPIRVEFDKAVCKAIGVAITDDDLADLYRVIVQEMIAIRSLGVD